MWIRTEHVDQNIANTGNKGNMENMGKPVTRSKEPLIGTNNMHKKGTGRILYKEYPENNAKQRSRKGSESEFQGGGGRVPVVGTN